MTTESFTLDPPQSGLRPASSTAPRARRSFMAGRLPASSRGNATLLTSFRVSKLRTM